MSKFKVGERVVIVSDNVYGDEFVGMNVKIKKHLWTSNGRNNDYPAGTECYAVNLPESVHETAYLDSELRKLTKLDKALK